MLKELLYDIWTMGVLILIKDVGNLFKALVNLVHMLLRRKQKC